MEHVQFLVECYKAWGKMHDPTTDGAISVFNYTIDGPFKTANADGTGVVTPIETP